jgi:lipopolysaccharide kinase (Kdo/WaaP) family protein
MNAWLPLVFGRLRWLVRPAWRERLFDHSGLRLEEWRDAQAVQVVKRAVHRTVYCVTLPGESIFIKHYPLNGLRSIVRQQLRPPKARTEMQHALALLERDVPTIEPIAVADTLGGESYLVTRALPATQRLDEFLLSAIADRAGEDLRRLRMQLVERLARFLARLHDVGVRHDDLHAGNLLIHPETLELFLIDLHTVRLGTPLSWPEARDNLALLSCSFVGGSSRTDRRRFWRQYVGNRRTSLLSRAEERRCAHALEAVTQRTALRVWRGRNHRSLKCGRQFYRLQERHGTARGVCELPRELLQALLVDPDRPFYSPAAKLLKDGRTTTVAEFDLLLDGRPQRVIFKRFNVTRRTDPWIHCVRRSPALRSWINGHVLLDRYLPTARPLALIERRRHALVRECYLLTEKLPYTKDLRRHVDELFTGPADAAPGMGVANLRRLRALVVSVAVLIRTMHDRQIDDRDLKAANICVQIGPTASAVDRSTDLPFRGSPKLYLIDLVGVTPRRRLSRRRMIQNLARLHASFHADPRITRTDKLRFLRNYLRWGVHGKQGWKRWWREIAAATARKIAKNRRRGRPLA